MNLLYSLIVLGLGAVAARLALKQLRARRRRRHADGERHARRQRLDRLAELVADGEHGGHLAPEIAARLRRFVEDLRAEAR